MIAKHNIKVNGRWIRAGEAYEPEKAEATKKAEAPEVKQETPKEAPVYGTAEPLKAEVNKTEAKPKSATRRKVSK